MVIAARPKTYEDLLATPEGDGNRYELISGEILVSASPAKRHVWLVNLIAFELTLFARQSGIGRAFSGPVDVRLSPNDVVVPDIIFLTNERLEHFGDRVIEGPPDLIVEVLSPSTRSRDSIAKRRLYARAGVPEYWIVDPDTSAVTIYSLSARGDYDAVPPADGVLASRVLAGFKISVAELFADIP